MVNRTSPFKVVLAAAALHCAVGCNQASSGYARYIPSASKSEEAMELVMAAWKNGAPAGALKLKSEPITIQVADSTRRRGQRLVGYQVLGEVSGEGPRTFVVRLKLENPRAEYDARYYLVGVDPLWVFRQEDYDAVAHWDACEADESTAGRNNHVHGEQPSARASRPANVAGSNPTGTP
jgi:hypothetical protein